MRKEQIKARGRKINVEFSDEDIEWILALHSQNLYRIDYIVQVRSYEKDTENAISRIKELAELRKNTPSINSLRTFQLKYGDIEGKNRWDIMIRKKACTKENMISRYGQEDGLRRWQAYVERQAETNSYSYKNKKYGMTLEAFNEYNRSRSSTKENMISRYGQEDGLRRWQAYVERQAYAGSSLQYFQDIFGEEEGLLKWQDICKSKANTLDNYLTRYGQEDGLSRWQAYVETNKVGGFSRISQDLFWKLYNDILIQEEKNHSYFYQLNYEYGIMADSLGYRKYDFVCTKLKLCIEFHGDWWHANPELYMPSDVMLHPAGKTTAKEIWQLDVYKKNLIIEKRGFEYIVVWENEYRKRPEEVMAKIEKYIEEIRKNK